MGLRTSLPSGLLKPQLWTNLKHKEGSSDEWHAVDMIVDKTNGGGVIYYAATFEPNVPGHYEYTVRIGVKKGTGTIEWKWAGGFGDNATVDVSDSINDSK